MAQPPSTKGDLRGAAQAIERGIERYGEGDLAGALAAFEEALALYPSSARARQSAAWVKDVQAGKRAIHPPRRDALDDDALRAVTEALDEAPADAMPHVGLPDAMLPELATPAAALGGGSQTGIEAQTTERRVDHLTGAIEMEAEPPEPGESPWDPVPLTPGGTPRPPERHADVLAELQSSPTRSAPPPQKPMSSPTILGMPPLEPAMLAQPGHKRHRVAEDRPESVTREFRHSAPPTGPNLRPLDVPELTDEQIHSLLALDSPLLPDASTSPQIEVDRLARLEDSGPNPLDDSGAHRLVELEAVPTPLPHPVPPSLRKNDTSPMGVTAFGDTAEFDPQQLTPTGVKPQGLKPVREPRPEDDPYADLNLLPLEVAPELSGPDEVEEGGTNPTNPFIRGQRMAAYVQPTGTDPKLDELPPAPTLAPRRRGTDELPGVTTPPAPVVTPLGRVEAALAANDHAAAVDALEAALAGAGGLGGELAQREQPLVERVYAGLLGDFRRVPIHGAATPDLDPKSAFLLSRIDGAMTIEDVLDVSGMPRLEALRGLAILVRRGAIVIR